MSGNAVRYAAKLERVACFSVVLRTGRNVNVRAVRGGNVQFSETGFDE
jgi:hypothetical protein